MNMMPGSLNPMQVGQSGHPMQQPHVMHGGIPMQPGMGGHPMHMTAGMGNMGQVIGQPAPGMMMGGPMGQGHMVGIQQMPQSSHQQQIQQQQQQQQFTQQPPQQQPEQIDPISKVKMFVPQLKESLNRLFIETSSVLNVNFQEAAERQIDPTLANRAEKSLEKFHSICDMMEMHIKLSMEVLVHSTESRKYVSRNVAEMTPTPQSQDPITYAQYVSIVRSQLEYAKELKELINNCAKKVNKHLSLTPTE